MLIRANKTLSPTEYKYIHEWITKRKSKPDLCPICELNKKLELANISGEYKLDIDDYEYLCRKCHYERYHKMYKLGFKCVICGSSETLIDERSGTPRWCHGMCSKCWLKEYTKNNRAKMTQYVRDWRKRRKTNL